LKQNLFTATLELRILLVGRILMVRMIGTISGVFGLLLTFSSLANAQNAPERSNPSLDLVNLARQTYIFQLSPDTSPAEVRRIAREAAGIGGGRPDHVYTAVMRGFSARMSDVDLLEIQEEFPEIVGIQRSNIFTISKGKPPGTPGGGGGGGDEGATSGGDTIPWGVARVLPKDDDGDTMVQNCYETECKTVWVLDTGIDLDNADLIVGTAPKSKNCVVKGKDSPDDGHGHGTHVAGTIAAIANGSGVLGVAAGATVAPVRVLNNRGYGTTAEVICGIDYIAANASAGDVANMSLGGPGDQMLDDAVLAAAGKDIFFSVAAGNDGKQATGSPARVNHPFVYTVSATDSDDYFAFFSNYGNPPVDYAAPGYSILSTKKGGGTETRSGTSMAAPHVAGLLSLRGNVADPENSVGRCGTAKDDPDDNADDIAFLLGKTCSLPGS
jgi:hypothetical protein